MSKLNKQVSIAGVMQNCYITDCRKEPIFSTRPPSTKKSYLALEEKTLPNGYVQNLVEKDYPITSESVSSYIESSDYRNDPASAIANAPKRVNLGDISELQNFMQDNPVEAAKQYAGILKRVSQYFENQAKASEPKKVPETEVVKDKKEVD